MKAPKTLLLLAALSVAVLTNSALAQTPPPGPVHFPANTAPAPASTPVTMPTPSSPAAMPASTASAGDIHDIHGVISIPYPWLWAMFVVGSIALAAALYAAWKFFRRQAKARAKLPFEIALERLEAARSLLAPETMREYAFTVSEVIRVYIEQRFGEKAAHRTTEEFLSGLLEQTGTPLARHRDRLEDFLGHCDLLKFARWELSVPEMESMHKSACDFVLETRPAPEPVKAHQAAPSPVMPEVSAQPELIESK